MFLPTSWPSIDVNILRDKSYEEVALHIMNPFVVGEISEEVLYEIIHKSRLTGKHNIALAYYKLLKPIKDKGNKLFVINHIYDYSLDIDISISGYYANEFYLAIKSFKNLFKNSEKIPIQLLKLTVSNFRFYIDKLDYKDQDFYNKFKKHIVFWFPFVIYTNSKIRLYRF